jgi:hypothetical protein
VSVNAGTSAGRMPAKLSVSERPTVTAGLAHEVEEVNHSAAVMYRPTIVATALGRDRTQVRIVKTRPKVAIASPAHCQIPVRPRATPHQDRQVEHQMRAHQVPIVAPTQLRGDVGQRVGRADPMPHEEAQSHAGLGAATSRVPSALNAAELTRSLWHFRVASVSPEAASDKLGGSCSPRGHGFRAAGDSSSLLQEVITYIVQERLPIVGEHVPDSGGAIL